MCVCFQGSEAVAAAARRLAGGAPTPTAAHPVLPHTVQEEGIVLRVLQTLLPHRWVSLLHGLAKLSHRKFSPPFVARRRSNVAVDGL